MRYFLLDANVLVSYYAKEDENRRVRENMAHLIAARAGKKAFLYVPNFCVAEVLRAFAKKCWSEQLYGDADESFEKFRKAFLEDIVDSRVFYSFELSRRHIRMTDSIYKTAAGMSFRTGAPPSAFDVLLIAMGYDLNQVHNGEFHIVTAERPVFDVCKKDPKLPKVLHIGEGDIPRALLA